MVEYGDYENLEIKFVIVLFDVCIVLKKKECFIRVDIGEIFFIIEISISIGNVEMKVRNEIKLNV